MSKLEKKTKMTNNKQIFQYNKVCRNNAIYKVLA